MVVVVIGRVSVEFLVDQEVVVGARVDKETVAVVLKRVVVRVKELAVGVRVIVVRVKEVEVGVFLTLVGIILIGINYSYITF